MSRVANFRDEIVGVALAMVAEGHSLRHIDRELQERFPGEPTPDYSTISRWTHDADLGAGLEKQEERIAALTARLYEDRLERVERGEEEMSITAAGVAYGIARDKYFKRTELKRPPAGLLPELLRAIAERAEEIRAERGVIQGAAILLPEETTR